MTIAKPRARPDNNRPPRRVHLLPDDSQVHAPKPPAAQPATTPHARPSEPKELTLDRGRIVPRKGKP